MARVGTGHVRVRNNASGSSAEGDVPAASSFPRQPALAMVSKLVTGASKTWHRLNGYDKLPRVIQRVSFADGIQADEIETHAAARSCRHSPLTIARFAVTHRQLQDAPIPLGSFLHSIIQSPHALRMRRQCTPPAAREQRYQSGVRE